MVCAVRGAHGRKIALAGLLAGAEIGVVPRDDVEGAAPAEDRRVRPVTVITDDGVRLAAEVVGGGSRVAVVFAHGRLVNRHYWQFQRAALAGTATLVLYDQRGHGRSARAFRDTCTIERLGDDLAAVIEQTLPCAMPVVLVGHSMGGMSIMSLAARRPGLFGSRIVGAALLSTSSGAPGALGPRLARVIPIFPDRMRERDPAMAARSPGVPAGATLGPHATRDHVRFVNDLVTADSTVGPPHDLLVHGRRAARPALRAVRMMIMVGSGDRLTPPVDGRRIAEALPEAVLTVVAGAGHLIGLERPDVVNRALRGFVGDCLVAREAVSV